jgi:DNA-binding NtrC family response regulator
MTIMAVEDDIHVASLLTAALTHEGHEVIAAHDAEEALALLAQQRPDALLLDVLLGELSGIDLLRQLRRTDQALPVVLLTGHATADIVEAAQRLGVTAILEKPFGLKRLPQALREALGGRVTRPRKPRARGRPVSRRPGDGENEQQAGATKRGDGPGSPNPSTVRGQNVRQPRRRD